jgi:hypothetical protein
MPPAKSGRSGAKIALLVVGLVVLICGLATVGIVFVVNRFSSEPSSTAVGDCMVGQSADDLKKIDCSDPKAEWKVVGRVGGKTEAESTVETTCSPWPDADTLYWEGRKGEKGYVLCLAPLKK